MNKVTKNGLSHTKGDTFLFEVTANEAFSEGSTLKFTVAKNEDETPVISNNYSLSNNTFSVSLSETDEKKLDIGIYVFKMTVLNLSGQIITQASGELEIKWGA